jgi:hypothetical protein
MALPSHSMDYPLISDAVHGVHLITKNTDEEKTKSPFLSLATGIKPESRAIH